MGEVSNNLVNGVVCSWCGKFFTYEYGYPVICQECTQGINKKELDELALRVADE